MDPYRGTLFTAVVLLAALSLSGCGNGPSGSYIRVTGVEPSVFEPDLYLTRCDGEDFEPGLTNTYAAVTMINQSAPNTPTGQSTNSFVTMNRYRVDFTGVSKTVSIPSINGGGQSVGIAADSTGMMNVLVMDFNTLDYIRAHYSSIGNGESLTLRATITIWGEDSFKVTVSTEAQVTLVIDNYDRC